MSYSSFKEFYPYYLQEHSDKRCRILHYIGSTLVLAVLTYALVSANYWWLLALPVIGYGFAWLGHFVFEKNKPATFQYPLYSLLGDWVMYKDAWVNLLTGNSKRR
ncbi:MAG: Mpo1-like protein [Pseudomonadota bacterium]